MSLTTWHDTRALAAPPAARMLPANIDAEQAVLGAIMINSAVLAQVGTRLTKEHFFEPANAMIYDVLVKLVADGKPASPIAARPFLPEEAAPDRPMWPYLCDLYAGAAAPITAPAYADMVVDMHARRAVIVAAQEAIDSAYDPPVDLPVAKIIDSALEQIRQVGDALPSPASEETNLTVFDTLVQRARDRIDGKGTTAPTSGLADLDARFAGGLWPGRLIVLAGRPGMGKSVLKSAIARRAAHKGHGVADFNLEIDANENLSRILANSLAGGSTPMDYRDIATGNLGEGQLERVMAARGWVESLPLEVCAKPGMTMQQIETRAVTMGKRLARRGRRLEVVLIDYLQLITVTDRYKGKLVDEYGELARAAKTMSQRLGVCVILLSQINRAVESRDGKRPTIADLRGSGNIEEHADAVGLIYRPAYYDRTDAKVLAEDPEAVARAKDREHDLELIWDKNRLGPPGSDHFYCNVGRSQVDSMSRHRMGGN